MSKLIHNCKIWTDSGYKEWLLFDENEIKEVGIGDHPASDEKIDLDGNFVFPGLIDSHIHVYGLGRELSRLRLNKPRSISELQNKLHEYSKKNQDLKWIIGNNWDQDYMEDNRYPSKEDLDLIVDDRPVLLFRACNHIGVVNSKALEILNIYSKTENPLGGIIEKDEHEVPTGILKETALSLVTDHIKITDYKTRKKIITLGLQKCVEVGLTMVQTNDPNCWEIYKELEKNDELPIRVALTIFENDLEREIRPTPSSRINFLSCDRVKLFADGSLGAQTAALRQPYSDTKAMGVSIHKQDDLDAKVLRIKQAGFRLEVHAIGDLAAEMVLKSFEKANISKDERPILTHCQILAQDLINKMSQLGVIANIQPQFVTTDSQWVEKRLGEGNERLKYAYAWKTLLNNQIPIAGGSDSPIELPNPLHGIYAAIFRKNPQNEIWRPEEKLSFNESLDMYTKGGAFATMMENQLGQLKENYFADFIVVDKDIGEKPEGIMDTKIIQVWVNGKKKF
ncbi:MAG: N-substituted formamide deformylase precursor [Candidatus Heimdallarchaeota archaeon LC_2]|nr:MAG: N-substituted formamide deformylase precursor [Candidatus Heimdallarchaeota archaeon LC_2]